MNTALNWMKSEAKVLESIKAYQTASVLQKALVCNYDQVDNALSKVSHTMQKDINNFTPV